MTGTGVTDVWDAVVRFRSALTHDGELTEARAAQATAWLWSEIGDTLLERFRSHPRIAARLEAVESDVAAGLISPGRAATDLLDEFVKD